MQSSTADFPSPNIEPEQGSAGHRDIWVIEINRCDQQVYVLRTNGKRAKRVWRATVLAPAFHV